MRDKLLHAALGGMIGLVIYVTLRPGDEYTAALMVGSGVAVGLLIGLLRRQV